MVTNLSSHNPPKPIGRFAPSPTGALHLGSLTTAIASYCHIKSLGGEWRLRIEDTDFQRCKPEFTTNILQDLDKLALHWDGNIIYQSQRTDIYNQFINNKLIKHCYGCQCSRKQLNQYFNNHPNDNLLIYPQICLNKNINFEHHKTRIHLPNYSIGFYDGIQQMQWQNPQKTLGDMVIRRDYMNSNGMINYILAVSIDDALQGITHVMRGLDIMPMTSAQIIIMYLAGFLPIYHWYHLPLVINTQGQKLSKQNLATPIDTSNPSLLIQYALQLLQQPAIDLDTPENMLVQAIAQWDNSLLNNQSIINI